MQQGTATWHKHESPTTLHKKYKFIPLQKYCLSKHTPTCLPQTTTLNFQKISGYFCQTFDNTIQKNAPRGIGALKQPEALLREKASDTLARRQTQAYTAPNSGASLATICWIICSITSLLLNPLVACARSIKPRRKTSSTLSTARLTGSNPSERLR